MDDTPTQFVHELKVTILRKGIGQIALAVVLAEQCIRFISAAIWDLIIPAIANALEGHTESILFQSRSRNFQWIHLFGATLELLGTIIFVFYVNRWIHARNRPRIREEVQPEPEDVGSPEQARRQDEDYEPIVPRLFSAPEAPSSQLLISIREHDHSDDK